MKLFGFSGPWAGTDDFAAARRLLQNTGSSASPNAFSGDGGCVGPHTHVEPDLAVAVRGDPIWWPQPAPAPSSPAAAIAAAWRTRGAQLLEGLHGSFALAILDARSKTVLLAVDRMGIEALAYSAQKDGIAFGTSLGDVVRLPRVGARVRNQALFDYFMMHMIPSPDTAFEGVNKLEPGMCLEWRDGRATPRPYWKPGFVEGHADSASLEAQLHESLRTAVRACQPDDKTGAFLSGGLDSSTVAGVYATVSEKPAKTFSIGFGVAAYNELDFARVAVRKFGLDSVEYHVTPDDIVSSFHKIAQAYEEPFGNSSAVPTYFCAKIAADRGITHLLAGDGGDEIFGGNDRYGRQPVFEAYGKIPAVLRRGLVEPLSKLIPAEIPVTPLRKLRSYIDQASIPLPERFEYWNLMYRSDISQMLDPQFQASIDRHGSLKLMSDVWARSGRVSLLNKMLSYDWHFTLADNDLRKVGTMCELAGVKVSYPMLDPRVIDVSLRVPSAMKMAGGTDLRTFYKRAMRDFLPREILEKTKHGFGLPFGVWIKTESRLAEMAFSLLTGLKARRIVRAEFIDQLIREQRAGDASYFGYAIWDLAMLEAWLQAHAPRFDASAR